MTSRTADYYYQLHPDELRRTRTLYAIVAVALFAALLLTAFQLGLNKANDKLPRCAEDEVLIFKTMPYDSTDDLLCAHPDNL